MKKIFSELRGRVGGAAQLPALTRFDDWLHGYPRAKPAIVFVIALSLVIVAAWSVELAQSRMRQAGWQSNADDIVSSLERQAASDAAYLDATSAFFGNVPDLTPEFFHNFAKRLRDVYELNDVFALGWAEQVQRRDLPALRARMERNGVPDFTLKPARPARWPVYPITMLEPPSDRNRTLLGFDLHADPHRAAAMNRARETRSIIATETLQPDGKGEAPLSRGMLVLAPVWSDEAGKNFRGFIYVPIRTNDYIRSALTDRLLESGRIEIFGAGPSGEELVYSSAPGGRQFEDALVEQLTMFDQQWTLRYYPLRRDGTFPLSLVIPIGGTAFSLLLLAYVLLVQRRNGDLRALVEAQREQEQERVAFIRELNHRVNNSLTNVTSLISLTRRHASDVDSFANTLLQRVRALATSHALFNGGNWGPTDLQNLIVAQVGANRISEGRVEVGGPPVVISPNDALAAGLALHELATNASRYGSLSNEEGHVVISWRTRDEEWVEISWVESGGPTVSAPESRGLGLNLIERALAAEFGRPVQIEFDPAGLKCLLYIRLHKQRTFKLRR